MGSLVCLFVSSLIAIVVTTLERTVDPSLLDERKLFCGTLAAGKGVVL